MLTAFLSLFLFISQVSNALPSKCCGSKTVGAHKYNLIKTDASVPDKCLSKCAYSREGEEGSQYCFASGEKPVTCEGEMDIPICYIGACPGEENTRLLGVPTYELTKETYEECYDFCRSVCAAPNKTCECEFWTWNQANKTCYGFAPGECYRSLSESGWWSGEVCFESDDSKIEELPDNGESARTYEYITYGNLKGANYFFSDYTASQSGPVSNIKLWEDSVTGVKGKVITGIQVTYGPITAQQHGNYGTESNFGIRDTPVNGVYGRSVNSLGSKSYIFQLGFYENSKKSVAVGTNLGPENGIGPFNDGVNSPTYQLQYIYGSTTGPDGTGILGRVTFAFRKID